MKDQSHKDEMSAALRGDFARLRERGVETTLPLRETTAVSETVLCQDVPEGHVEEDAPSASESEPDDASLSIGASLISERVVPPGPDADRVSDTGSPSSRRGWLDRLRGRA